MEITGIEITNTAGKRGRLLAYCKVVLDDCFVIHDLKIVSGNRGMFVAMPERRKMRPCPACDARNHMLANYCNACGGKLSASAGYCEACGGSCVWGVDKRPCRLCAGTGKKKVYTEIAHPVTAEFRTRLNKAVFSAYQDCKAVIGGGPLIDAPKPLPVDQDCGTAAGEEADRHEAAAEALWENSDLEDK